MNVTRLEGIVLALSAALYACGRTPVQEKSPRPVKVEVVQRQAAASGTRYSANIQPYEQVSLAFKVGGYVQDIHQRRGLEGLRSLQQGDEVRKNTVLARVRETDYQESVNIARGQQAEAQASLTKAELDYERAERLYASQSLTRPDYDAARAALDASRARVESATARVASAEISLRDCSLVAPMDSVVLQRSVEPGFLASPGVPVFVLADIRRVKVVFGVPDHVAQELRLGMAVPFFSETLGSTAFEGRITAISPSADSQSRVFSVELTVPNQDRRLKPGMIAAVQLKGVLPNDEAAAEGLPSVPLAAVVESEGDSGGYAVFVVEGDAGRKVARLRPVTLGPISGNRIAVPTGLTLDDRVVVSGATLLVDGETVREIH